MLSIVKLTGWILAALPKQFAQVVAAFVGDFIYFLPSRRRRTLLSNFHHAFPDKPETWQRNKARTSCKRMVEMALFNLALPYFSEEQLDRILITTDESVELLKNYVEPTKPIVGVTVHNSMMEACTLLRRSIPIDTPEIGVLYRPINQKAVDAFSRENRTKNGVTLVDRRKGLHQARKLIKDKNWVVFVFDQSVGDSGYLTYFLERAATTTGFHQFLSHAYSADVLGFYGERTGFWEGNLHIVKIADGNKDEPVILKTNQWLEEKLMGDDSFSEDWMWIHNRWKAQTKLSQNLNLNFRKSLLEETKAFYNWDSLPKKNRILLRMPNHLGELIKWIPFIKAIQSSRPDAEITLLVNRNFSDLIESLQVSDRTLSIPKRNTAYYLKFLKLQNSFPDTYYQLTESTSADLEAKLINAPRRYGMCWPGSTRLFLTDTFNIDPGWDEKKNHQAALWEEFLRFFGLQTEIDFSPLQLAPGYEVINPLRCLQTESHDAPYFGLICGAGNEPEKCWPTDYWVECIAALMDLYPDGNICLFGTSADLDVSRQIVAQFEPGSIHDFTGSTTLMQFVMALKSCSVIISNDCGGLHLANALGVPTVGLYGLTNPVNTRPVYTSPSKVIQPLDCPNHGGSPIDGICLSQVLEAIAETIPQPRTSKKKVSFAG